MVEPTILNNSFHSLLHFAADHTIFATCTGLQTVGIVTAAAVEAIVSTLDGQEHYFELSNANKSEFLASYTYVSMMSIEWSSPSNIRFFYFRVKAVLRSTAPYLIGLYRLSEKVVLQIDMLVPLIGRRVICRIDCSIVVCSDCGAWRFG